MNNQTCGCSNHEEEEKVTSCCEGTEENCCNTEGEDCACGDDCGCDDDCEDGEGGCGCGCAHDSEMETITLQTEDGEDLNCLVIGTFEVEGKTYIALLPEGEEDVFIYGYAQDGDNVQLDRIETDEEYEKVGAVFMEMWGEEDEEGDEE